jgi:hypothetical protein
MAERARLGRLPPVFRQPRSTYLLPPVDGDSLIVGKVGLVGPVLRVGQKNKLDGEAGRQNRMPRLLTARIKREKRAVGKRAGVANAFSAAIRAAESRVHGQQLSSPA